MPAEPSSLVPRVGSLPESCEFKLQLTSGVLEYTEKYYLPLANAYLRRSSDGGKSAENLLQWKRHLAEHWSRLRFCSVHVESVGEFHHFEIQVYLDEMERRC